MAGSSQVSCLLSLGLNLTQTSQFQVAGLVLVMGGEVLDFLVFFTIKRYYF